MIKVSSNLNQVTSKLLGRIKSIANPDGPVIDKMLRIIALDTVANVKERIHEKGLNTEEKGIGKYSNSYLKIREKKNRSDDKKVIFSLTRQMENDFNIISGGYSNTYNIGFKNKLNNDKKNWLENGTESHTVKEYTRKVNGKEIKVKSHSRKGHDGYGNVYKLSKTEINHINKLSDYYITKIMNGENP